MALGLNMPLMDFPWHDCSKRGLSRVIDDGDHSSGTTRSVEPSCGAQIITRAGKLAASIVMPRSLHRRWCTQVLARSAAQARKSSGDLQTALCETGEKSEWVVPG